MAKNLLIYIFFVLILFISIEEISSNLECNTDAQCIGLENSFCHNGYCVCPPGQKIYLGSCMPFSPYLFSPCEFDIQCERLVTGYHCNNKTQQCECLEGLRYKNGRCWEKREYGENCITKEQCFHPLQLNSMDCISGVCTCADGYYRRQKEECRKIVDKLGDTCILNSDCQIEESPEAICNNVTLKCSLPTYNVEYVYDIVDRSIDYVDDSFYSNHDTRKTLEDACDSDEECAEFGEAICLNRQCTCKIGYYPNSNNKSCSAELGKPIPDKKTVCQGRSAVNVNGICDCPNGFFYDTNNNRDCKKPARYFGDSCGNDEFCYTFGAAGRCVQIEDSFYKTCDCDTTISTKDEERQMCILFSKEIGSVCVEGDICPTGSECIDGECSCFNNTIPSPDNTICLELDLDLNKPCVMDEQCIANFSGCVNGICSCVEGYFYDNDECVPGVGSDCENDDDCNIENTYCEILDTNSTDSTEYFNSTEGNCVCKMGFINNENKECLKMASSVGEKCTVLEQCKSLGKDGSFDCVNKKCVCKNGFHENHGGCWDITGLNAPCSKVQQCYLSENIDRVHCMNSVCRCKFQYTAEYFPDRCSGSNSLQTTMTGLLLIMMALKKALNRSV